MRALHRIIGRLSSSKSLEVSYRAHRSHPRLMMKATQVTTRTTSRGEVSYESMENGDAVVLTMNLRGLRGGGFGRMCLREICPR